MKSWDATELDFDAQTFSGVVRLFRLRDPGRAEAIAGAAAVRLSQTLAVRVPVAGATREHAFRSTSAWVAHRPGRVRAAIGCRCEAAAAGRVLRAAPSRNPANR